MLVFTVACKKSRKEAIIHTSKEGPYLSHRCCQKIDDPLVRHCHDALAVDLDDAVAHAHAAALGDAAAQEAADLEEREKVLT